MIFWKIYFVIVCLLLILNWATGGLTAFGFRHIIDIVVTLPALLALFGYAFRKRFLSATTWKVYSIVFIIYVIYITFDQIVSHQSIDLVEFSLGTLLEGPLYIVPLIYAFRFMSRSQNLQSS